MRIMFVALPSNIHAARWITQFVDLGWDIHLVPSLQDDLHPDLCGKVTFHDLRQGRQREMPSPVDIAISILRRWPHHRGSGHARRLMERLRPGSTAPILPSGLARIITRVRPDIIHSLIIQQAGYDTLAARWAIGEGFPPWIAGLWGSDIHFFANLAAHKVQVEQVLTTCDYVACECERDLNLARARGYTGPALPILPAAGGFDLDRWQALRQAGPPSGRRMILLKGYQHTVGRALVGLRAIELCADVLQDYRVLIHLASPDVQIAAEVVANRTGVPIDTVPLAKHATYTEIMRRYGRAHPHRPEYF